MPSVYFDPDLGDAARRSRLYAGDLFVLSATPATEALIGLGKAMLLEAFAPHDPHTVHERLTPEEVAAILAQLKRRSSTTANASG